MKLFYTLVIAVIALTACKKEMSVANPDVYMKNVKLSLKDSMGREDYATLDFSKTVSNRIDSVGLLFMRIPFRGQAMAESFVILKIEKEGNIKAGKIIQLNGGVRHVGESPVIQREWEGSISISSLNRKSVIRSAVHNGYIEAFHNEENERGQLKGPDELPEVIIVTYVNNTPDYSTWFWLNGFFYSNNFDVGGDEGGGNYYGSLDGGGGGSYSDVGTAIDPTILVDLDTYVDHAAIDIDQYLKCFAAIPDDGAKCSVEIFTDIPVDSDPAKLFNWQTRSPGHTFLQLKKTSADGSQSVIQNIGFYPTANWKNILDADPVNSKLVDDGSHEFNASLLMDINPNRFSSVIGKIMELSTMNYDMDEFNCTDFALEVFNYVRNPIQIPQYPIPGSVGTVASNTPQGLYMKLKDMKNSGDPESANIKLPGVKGWVSDSHGPCN